MRPRRVCHRTFCRPSCRRLGLDRALRSGSTPHSCLLLSFAFAWACISTFSDVGVSATTPGMTTSSTLSMMSTTMQRLLPGREADGDVVASYIMLLPRRVMRNFSAVMTVTTETAVVRMGDTVINQTLRFWRSRTRALLVHRMVENGTIL